MRATPIETITSFTFKVIFLSIAFLLCCTSV